VSLEFNLRFPGQYFDKETGLFYNYFRDYDPQTGRYVQSDPIGLAGGINPFLYARSDPLRFVDPAGLEVVCRYVVGGYYDRTITETVEEGYWTVECVAKPRPVPGLPDPTGRPAPRRIPGPRGPVPLPPVDIQFEMECRDKWVVTRREYQTRTERWSWGWMQCEDTCTGKITKTWMPDRSANDPLPTLR
jgi:RHS repeat-associated protein